MSLLWRDVTSWRKSDDVEARKTPRTLEASCGALRLTVTRSINYGPQDWICGVHPNVIGEFVVHKGDLEFAQQELIRRIKQMLKTHLEVVERETA